MTPATLASLCSLVIPAGAWMIYGNASFRMGGNAGFIQVSISNSSTCVDDTLQVTQYNQTTANGDNMTVPVMLRYYAGRGMTLYVLALAASSSATGNSGAGVYSCMQAVRVGKKLLFKNV